jgi:PIN domain nuclease of toxin-antitoxin system
MRLLLDTHALVWFLMGSSRLSGAARAAIEDPENAVMASPVSGYEVAYKHRQGRLDFNVLDELPQMLRKAGIPTHPITLDAAIEAGMLPGPHRDPWDRLLMAQARLGGFAVVTIDATFREYGLPVVW